MADSGSETNQPPLLGYEGLARGHAYDFWREEFGRQVMSTDLVPIVDGPVRRHIKLVTLPHLKMSPSIGTPLRFSSMGANDDLVVVMSSDSPLHAVSQDRVIDLSEGDISLGDASRKGAYFAQLSEGNFKTMLLDRKALLLACPNAEDSVARQLNRDPALASLFHGYYDLAMKHATSLDALGQDAVSRHLMDLVVLLLGGRRDDQDLAKSRGVTAARFEAIKAEIMSRLPDGKLNLASIAQNHRVSPRYVQLMFEGAGTTYSEFVLERRLLRSLRLLQEPANSTLRIGEIAYLVGFNDLSYFNQTFRRRFGMTPSDIRAEASKARRRGG